MNTFILYYNYIQFLFFCFYVFKDNINYEIHKFRKLKNMFVLNLLQK